MISTRLDLPLPFQPRRIMLILQTREELDALFTLTLEKSSDPEHKLINGMLDQLRQCL